MKLKCFVFLFRSYARVGIFFVPQMMDFVFVFCIPWIVVSNARCRNLLKLSCAVSYVFLFSCTWVLANDESVDKEFLIKSSKVIEAYPHILRRSASGLPDGKLCFQNSSFPSLKTHLLALYSLIPKNDSSGENNSMCLLVFLIYVCLKYLE